MSLSATAEAGAPAPARARRATLELVADSLALVRDGWKELAGVVLVGVVPGSVLLLAATAVSGLYVEQNRWLAVLGEEPARLIPAALALGVAKVLGLFMTPALILACDARDRGRPLSAAGAWVGAFAAWRPFLEGLARVVLRAAAWSLLFVLPGLASGLRGSFFLHAVLIEGLGGKEGAARSRRLAGRAPLYLLGNLLASALIAGAGVFMGVLALRLAYDVPAEAVPRMGGPLEAELVSMLDGLVSGAAAAWTAAFTVLLYKDAADVQ